MIRVGIGRVVVVPMVMVVVMMMPVAMAVPVTVMMSMIVVMVVARHLQPALARAEGVAQGAVRHVRAGRRRSLPFRSPEK